MSFSKQLTDLYHLIKNSGDSLEYVYSKDFENYLMDLNVQQFVDSIFVYGYEVRDDLLGTIDSEILKLLELLDKVYNSKFKTEIESSDKLRTIYNLGIINIYLYFCEREELITDSVDYNDSLKLYLAEKEPNLLLPEGTNSIKTVDINRSVDFLRKATKLTAETMDISKGIYTYHVIRTFEYIFDIFRNYIVDNDDKPIDLDSFYVFSDQLDSEELWLELARQMKVKSGLQQ